MHPAGLPPAASCDTRHPMYEGMLVADKYRLLDPIGQGGMGAVWRAKHEVTERIVAVKFLSAVHAQSPALIERFLREAKLAGRLTHPGLVAVLDAGVVDSGTGGPFLVMELLNGVPLDRAILRAGSLPVNIALEILHGVALAMVEVHDKGIIHRDLKPGNLFMHRPGTGGIITKVVDFGISKVAIPQSSAMPYSLTKTGDVIGSPRYMSPEQAAGDRSIDVRSDIHSMGAILYECITGKPLFDASTVADLASQILTGPRIRLDRDGTVPRAVGDLIERAAAIERSERYPSSLAFAYAIEKVMGDLGHVPILSMRDGAERFLAMLGPELPVVASGTSLISEQLPLRSASPVVFLPAQPPSVPPSGPPLAKSGSVAPAACPSQSRSDAIAAAATRAVPYSSSPPPKPLTNLRPVALLALSVVAVVCMGAVVGVLLTRAFAPRSAGPSSSAGPTVSLTSSPPSNQR